MEIVYERVAGIDVHKRQITVAVRSPGQGTKRRTAVRRFATFYAALREMTAWLLAEGVSHVAMESTGVYWMPVLHALAEPDSLEIVLCNAQHVKNVPGRKTDVKDAQWLAQLMEVGLLRGSFIPPPQIAVIRQLCRYRRTLIEERTREGQRLRKVLEDGGIKLDSVASDVLGVSARAMIRALIAGERDPAVLADLAQRTLRRKIPDLTLALAGRFAAHHGVLCELHLDHIDHLDTMLARLDTRIGTAIRPVHRRLPATDQHISLRCPSTARRNDRGQRMTLAAKGSRRITVDGVAFRWSIRRRPTYCQANGWSPLTFVVEQTEQRGALLMVSLPYAHSGNWLGLRSQPVLPGAVATRIWFAELCPCRSYDRHGDADPNTAPRSRSQLDPVDGSADERST
jgi:transposase